MTSKVFHVPFADGESMAAICEKTRRIFRGAGLGEVGAGSRLTAVKTHFGERGNASYVPAPFVKVVVEEVAAAGGRPCLVETSTLYRGQRHNAVDHFNLAVEHGFGPEQMGCPLLFLDGLRGNMHEEVAVSLKHCETVAMAADLAWFPSVIVVTHLTGHLLGGMGGAIKNVAMGLASRAGKLRMHSGGSPFIEEAECTACGTCAKWCPEDAISLPERAEINYELCVGCGECVAVCPVGAVGFSWDTPSTTFNEKMAEYARGILKGKRAGFLTYLHRVTRDCNCMGSDGEAVCPDLGVLASHDAVAIDQAAADLVNEVHGGDLFEDLWPGNEYAAQLAHGELVGLGTRDYEMVRL
ncbi:MAG: hypothetical protein AMK73_02650 [Planctomycetes bacterium SM23_32]|nr:MAG: hypothetical protein AMK73_02650 [Planctomycetes bacterium SM23_32]